MFMEIKQRVVGDVTVLDMKGRMILEEGEVPFRAAIDGLVEQDRLKIVLNFQDITYVDSAGLGLLVAKYVRVRRRGGNVKLLHLTPRSAHVMHITNLEKVFEIYQSEDDAVQSFARNDAHPEAVRL